ncbi:unnamed protein product [Triticum turgidum subsp. durum]|uniref:Uncharacterized protein n=1 Tax=Triticum turgidum subsp. durum TaxID=4567 RepID=A0A9R1P8F5_TRITD|nr:unnamed protein product [Triticum turgidum subsp. durum]
MKKLYQGKGRRVHPAPAPGPDAPAVALAMLPATLLALVAALTAEEQEVLAYLLSGEAGGAAAGAGGGRCRRLNGPHQPEMGCGCFGCYKSFWARWDASPNRHLIHRIIDAVEEGNGGGGEGAAKGAGGPGGATRRGHRRRRRGRGGPCAIDAAVEEHGAAEAQAGCADDHLQPQGCCASDGGEDGDYEGDEDDGADSLYGGEEALTDDSDCAGASNSAEKSAVGKLVRFIGEKVWAAWT